MMKHAHDDFYCCMLKEKAGTRDGEIVWSRVATWLTVPRQNLAQFCVGEACLLQISPSPNPPPASTMKAGRVHGRREEGGIPHVLQATWHTDRTTKRNKNSLKALGQLPRALDPLVCHPLSVTRHVCGKDPRQSFPPAFLAPMGWPKPRRPLLTKYGQRPRKGVGWGVGLRPEVRKDSHRPGGRKRGRGET